MYFWFIGEVRDRSQYIQLHAMWHVHICEYDYDICKTMGEFGGGECVCIGNRCNVNMMVINHFTFYVPVLYLQ